MYRARPVFREAISEIILSLASQPIKRYVFLLISEKFKSHSSFQNVRKLKKMLTILPPKPHLATSISEAKVLSENTKSTWHFLATYEATQPPSDSP
jgi:hypothetical protein